MFSSLPERLRVIMMYFIYFLLLNAYRVVRVRVCVCDAVTVARHVLFDLYIHA